MPASKQLELPALSSCHRRSFSFSKRQAEERPLPRCWFHGLGTNTSQESARVGQPRPERVVPQAAAEQLFWQRMPRNSATCLFSLPGMADSRCHGLDCNKVWVWAAFANHILSMWSSHDEGHVTAGALLQVPWTDLTIQTGCVRVLMQREPAWREK